MILLDEAARTRLVDRFGPDVAPWCDALPSLVDSLTARWGLEVVSALAGNTGRTLMCRDRVGRSTVLKLTPQLDIAATEAAALRAWAGLPRVVRLLDADYEAGAVLLEGIEPGTQMVTEEVPLGELAELLTQLHSVPGADGVPTIAERLVGFFDLAERRWRESVVKEYIPLDVLHRSRAAATELATSGPTALVHGDLHPANVLRGPDGIVAIDPRPCVGDPAFDAVDWIFLPVSRGQRLGDSIATLGAALPELDTDRVRGWCEALAVIVALSPLRRDGPTPYTDMLLRMTP
ncbi:aminoglycoside phosphotransferase family protein [Amycolatopsis sp.]|uniref:aminoglycoside phosphotransferase family protein n=1 Tax=Amycolatopsis sp. TaxID=37632 RepID=UPI002E033995|nr:aminoglycoside phosphotransferase family protein [Amycolatopsis sp.]